MRIAIIGGEKSLIDGNWARRLAEHDLNVVLQSNDKSRTRAATLPKTVEGVIIVRDMARHQVADPARLEAKERGIPCACVPRKWSKAEPILRMCGILPPVSSGRKPSAATRSEMATAYVVEARREGRIPKKDEVLGALRRAFGSGIRLGGREYSKLCNEAAQAQPVLGTTETPTPTAPSDGYEWATAVLNERPELVLDMADLVTQVSALADTATPTQVGNACTDAIGDIRLVWQEAPAVRKAATAGWIKQCFLDWVKGEAPYPRGRLLKEKGKEIFGVYPGLAAAREPRVAVLGEWARELIGLSMAQRHLDKKRPGRDIRKLLETKSIKGFLVPSEYADRGGRWFTSTVAIDEYTATVAPVEVEPEPEPAEKIDWDAAGLGTKPDFQVADELGLKPPPVPMSADALTTVVAEAVKAALAGFTPEVTVDVDVDLKAINLQLTRIELAVTEGLAHLGELLKRQHDALHTLEVRADRIEILYERIAEQGSPAELPGFGPAFEAVVDGVSERQVEVSIRPVRVSGK
jgi:hypothetical protein